MADSSFRVSRDTKSFLLDNPETRDGFNPPKNVRPYHTRANRQGIPPETRPLDRTPLLPNFQEHRAPADDARGSPQRVQDSRTDSNNTTPVNTLSVSALGPCTVPERTLRRASPTRDDRHAALAQAAPRRADPRSTSLYAPPSDSPMYTHTGPRAVQSRPAPAHTPPSPHATPTHTHLNATSAHTYSHAVNTQTHCHATLTHTDSDAASVRTPPRLFAAPATPTQHSPYRHDLSAQSHLCAASTDMYSRVAPAHSHLHPASTRIHPHPDPFAAPTRGHPASNHAHPQAAAPAPHALQSSIVNTSSSTIHAPNAARPHSNTSPMIDPGMRSVKEACAPVDLSDDRRMNGASVQHSSIGTGARHAVDSAPSNQFRTPSAHSMPRNDTYSSQQQKHGFLPHGDGPSAAPLVSRQPAPRPISDTYNPSSVQPKTSPDGLPINTCPLPPDPGMASQMPKDRLERGFSSNAPVASTGHKDALMERRSRTCEPPTHAHVASTPQLGKSPINQHPTRNILSEMSKPMDPGVEPAGKMRSASFSPQPQSARHMTGARQLYFNKLVC